MFQRSSCNIDHIYGYAQACERYDSIVPIRGTNIRPLSSRRYKHMQILKHDNGDIACRLYETDVITFKEMPKLNGYVVVRLGGWASPTTSEFVNAVLGLRTWLFDNRMWCMAAHEGSVRNFPLDSHKGNDFFLNLMGDWAIMDPKRHYVHKVNRAGANNVRKRYADFRAYIDRTVRLRADDKRLAKINYGEMIEVFGPSEKNFKMPPELWFGPNYKTDPKTYADFQVLIDRYGDEDKTQDYYKAFLWLAWSSDEYRRIEKVSSEGMLKILDRLILFFHREEAFTKVDCFGEVKKDPHIKFFSQPHD